MTQPNRLSLFRRSNKQRNDNKDDGSNSPSVVRQTRRKSLGMRSVFGGLRGRSPGPDDLEIQSSEEAPPQIPQLVVTFVRMLDTHKFSDFFIWFLYYDLVKLPESPSRWYKPIDSMEMRGWIRLGAFLATRTPYGLNLVVMDSICDRLRLDKRVVHECLRRLADPQKMAHTQLAATFQVAKQEYKTEVETLELVQAKLQKLRALASSLKPTPDSQTAAMQPLIAQRVREFLNLVVNPRITALREEVALSVDNFDEEGRKIAYLFEAMQLERQVPLIRYGIYPDPLLPLSVSSSSGSFEIEALPELDQALVNAECETERSFSAGSLKSQVRLLRSRILQQEAEKQSLVKQNAKLARKFSRFGQAQPQAYGQAGSSQSSQASGVESELKITERGYGELDLYLSGPRTPPRGSRRQSALGRDTFPGFADVPMTMPRQTSVLALSTGSSVSSDYQDVFGGLNGTPLPALHLTDPVTGIETPPSSPPAPPRLPRSIGVYDLTAAVRNGAYTALSTTSPGDHELVRSSGVPNLAITALMEINDTLSSPADSTSPAVSEHSRKSRGSEQQPGPHNSMEELQARELNLSAIQRPVSPYQTRAGTSPLPLHAARGAVNLIRRQASCLVVQRERPESGRVRSRSLNDALSVFRRRRGEEQQDPDISRNF